MTYVAQLLPDANEARILMRALNEYASKRDCGSDEEQHDADIAYGIMAKLHTDMKRR